MTMTMTMPALTKEDLPASRGGLIFPSGYRPKVVPSTALVRIVRTTSVVAIVPAHNEQDTIVATVRGLLAQTWRIDKIVVVADNCTDNTERVLLKTFGDEVTIIKTVDNTDRKVGALRQGWEASNAMAFDFVLGVDADTVLTEDSVEMLQAEMARNPRLGGVSARYTFDPSLGRTSSERLLIRLQRLEFASSGLDTMYHKRHTYVLGGQATLFRVKAMQEVVDGENLYSPWNPEDQVEDMGLTWNLKELGWEVKVSATARAFAGPMLSVRSLYAQRRKWDGGTLRLLFKTKPWIAMQVWGLQVRNLLDVTVRAMFVILLTASLTLGIYRWSNWWLIPPAVAILLNYKVARKVPGRSFLDTVLAVLLMPVEIYLIFRLVIWSVSLIKTIFGSRKDGWSAQYAAERKTQS
jgi:biofilm PGA synthesis N-glycosyltransferase PgaC